MIKFVQSNVGGRWILFCEFKTIYEDTEESALIEAEKQLRTDLDDLQQRLTTARQRVKAAGSPSY